MMFPSGNIRSEISRNSENVPGRERRIDDQPWCKDTTAPGALPAAWGPASFWITDWHLPGQQGTKRHRSSREENPLAFNPLAGNALQNRDDVADAVRALFEPLRASFSPGCARVRIGNHGAVFDETAAELEGFARPLWGLVPLAVGGYSFDHWELFRRGIANGTDPFHAEYWGKARHSDQRLVEMAALGFALAMAPEQVWQPLPSGVRSNLVQWLSVINDVTPEGNNWGFFPVLVNLGLKRVGAPYDDAVVQKSLTRLDQFYVGEGWYRDGDVPQLDHYIAFAFHFYGLIYSRLQDKDDPSRAAIYRERAARFAHQYRHWFADDGAAIPFGRSLTYRFAVAAFWGALAFTDINPLPWSEVRGLYLRQLRWWAQRPIADRSGILSVGYGYPNLLMAEEYNSPQSPYWAMKAFLPLAVSPTHPFWRDHESASTAPTLAIQPHPGMIILRSPTHAVSLSSGQSTRRYRQGPAKYAKFAYSSRFGFSVENNCGGQDRGVYDNMLAIAYADDPDQYRVRETVEAASVTPSFIYSRWRPWHDVEVETWLVPIALPWLLRIHRLRATRPIHTKEGGFAIDRTGDRREPVAPAPYSKEGHLVAVLPAGASGIRDLSGGRVALVGRALPNTNVMHPTTIIPMLIGRHPSGARLLVTAVFATAEPKELNQWHRLPTVPNGPWVN
jgi:hypothetical protein